MMRLGFYLLVVAFISCGAGLLAPAGATAGEVIELTQTGCQFLESENGVDRAFQPKNAEECKQINAESGLERLREARVLELESLETGFIGRV